MSMESEFKAKFGGFWNSLVILLVIIICLRFSSIELAEEDLGTRLACSLQLFLACIGAGIVLGILRIFLSFSMIPIHVRRLLQILPQVSDSESWRVVQ